MSRKIVVVPALLLMAVLILSACSATAQTGLKADHPDAVLTDDFSDVSSGWNRAAGDHGSTDYADGAFHIKVNSAKYDLWSNPHLNLSDGSIEADVTKVTGPEENDFGLICRYKDVSNFYFAEITSQGYYGLGKMLNGLQMLSSKGYIATDLVKTGNATNHLRMDCVGDEISLYINGSLAGTLTDTNFSEGDVGLIAGTFKTGGLDIAFDNVVVSKEKAK